MEAVEEERRKMEDEGRKQMTKAIARTMPPSTFSPFFSSSFTLSFPLPSSTSLLFVSFHQHPFLLSLHPILFPSSQLLYSYFLTLSLLYIRSLFIYIHFSFYFPSLFLSRIYLFSFGLFHDRPFFFSSFIFSFFFHRTLPYNLLPYVPFFHFLNSFLLSYFPALPSLLFLRSFSVIRFHELKLLSFISLTLSVCHISFPFFPLIFAALLCPMFPQSPFPLIHSPSLITSPSLPQNNGRLSLNLLEQRRVEGKVGG